MGVKVVFGLMSDDTFAHAHRRAAFVERRRLSE